MVPPCTRDTLEVQHPCSSPCASLLSPLNPLPSSEGLMTLFWCLTQSTERDTTDCHVRWQGDPLTWVSPSQQVNSLGFQSRDPINAPFPVSFQLCHQLIHSLICGLLYPATISFCCYQSTSVHCTSCIQWRTGLRYHAALDPPFLQEAQLWMLSQPYLTSLKDVGDLPK